MTAILARRLGFAFVVLAAVSMITFAMLAFVPGDPARMIAGPQATPATVERLRQDLGLDQPLPLQYAAYVGRVLQGDFGSSVVTGRPVMQELLSRAPATLELMTLALLASVIIGGALGIWAARNAGRWPDTVVRGLAVFGVSAPGFWIGMLLIVVFYRSLDLLPSGGRMSGFEPDGPTGFLLIDTLVAGNPAGFFDAASHLILPIAAMALAEVGSVARLVRAQTLGVLDRDYMRMARAGGLSEDEAVFEHGLRNVFIPMVPLVGLAFAQLVSGSVVIETVFAWPGVGSYVVASIFALDFPVILGFALMASVAYVVANLAADLLQSWLDPRIRDAV